MSVIAKRALPFDVTSLPEQVGIWRTIFPGIGGANEDLFASQLPPGADFVMAMPRAEVVVRGGALDRVALRALEILCLKFRGLEYSATFPFGYGHYSSRPSTLSGVARLEEEQSGFGVLLIPVNLGLGRGGFSRSKACASIDEPKQKISPYASLPPPPPTHKEFGLGVWGVVSLLVTQPDFLRRLVEGGQSVGCAGEEYARNGARFDSTTAFFGSRSRRKSGGCLRFGLVGFNDAGFNMIWPSGVVSCSRRNRTQNV